MKYEYTEEVLSIARFMGIKPIKGIDEHTGSEYYYYNNPEHQDFEGLPFYNTWDELMPVVEKIESVMEKSPKRKKGECIDIKGKYTWIGYYDIPNECFGGSTKIESVFKAVSWWISKYNK